MPSPRIAERIVWSEDNAKRSDAHWGCWDFGFEDSYVRDTDKDSEHVRVRRRMCTRCGAMWETEERRIVKGSFFARAERRRYAHFRKTRYVIRTCLMCHERYMSGHYKAHARLTMAHLEVVARREERKRARDREYNRRWMAAKRAVRRNEDAA